MSPEQEQKSVFKVPATLTVAVIIIAFSHTAQVWLWASVWIWYHLLPDWNEAVYFSMVTYTSLSYGDIVLAPPARVFASFATVTCVLAFGMSTALMVALMARMFGFRED